MSPAVDDLLDYAIRIAPALVLVVIVYILLRGKQALPVRIFLVIMGFLVVRDTMLLYGFWGYGVAEGWVPWLRFIDEPYLVYGLAVASLAMTALLVLVERDGFTLLVWGKPSFAHLGWGLLGGFVIGAPIAAIYQFVPLAERGGPLPSRMLLPMLAVAAFGNLTEDILMRGYVQGYLATFYSPLRAAVCAGMFYAVGHIFLVTSVTSLGLPILLLALYDGLVCSVVRMKSGIIPAAISHGLAIVVLGMGLF